MDYPGDRADATYYGVRVLQFEEGGFVALGEGRRALAAVNAYGREMDGWGWRLSPPVKVEQRRVHFLESCGCSPEHVAAHHDDGCDCEYPSLPPCGDEWSWAITSAHPDAPNALPVVEASW
jgi:hypothetical protein